ncbi:Variant-specific surface protein, partial [Giardia duodenalis]
VNDPAGVPIDSLCRPSSSPQAITAGCIGKDGAALTDSSTACESCGSGFFLFRGGCYKAGQVPGSSICTKTEGGRCTTCKTEGSYIFQNKAATVTLGNECILCSDAKGADGVTGVAGCSQCTKADSNTGAATCSACQAGYVKDANANVCKPCGTGCSACSVDNTDQCTACLEGKYLNGNACIDGTGDTCGQGKYADPTTNECKSCATETSIPECTACTYSDSLQKPVCSACNSAEQNKLLKKNTDGTTTCVDANGCKSGSTHFVNDSSDKCIPCNDTTTGSTDNDRGKEGCMTCTKSSGQAPVCSACLSGYTGTDTCTKCADNCATCSEANNENRCLTCMTGYFPVDATDSQGKRCVPCDDAASGIEGCATCSFSGSLACSSCKPNYKQSGPADSVICTKACEDPTACGGTAGACNAIVISASGEMTYYCSLCGDSTKIPIDGKCVDKNTNANSNTCDRGVCTQCADGYFLYMGGCYNTQATPGNLMCKTAEGGFCTAAANNRYFKIPGASNQQQSVLACENPVGTTVGDSAYVGVEDCAACTAPSEAPSGAMAPARCTACSSSNKKPSLLGSGCFTCAMDGCSHCSADGVCEACTSAEQRPSTDGKQCIACNISGCTRCSEASKCSQCSDGYRLEGDTCVSTGPNLSTGAIAGISVAAVVVVGGLVGFLCWWFVCRGKA